MAADVLKEWHPDFSWTCKGWSDIDKYACQMHNLVFPQFAECALGDITKIDWHAVKRSLQGREVDIFTYSSPCQDISQAGKQMGLQEGSDTRSALLWRVADAVEVLQPKYFLQENVAALVSKKFMPDFQKWLDNSPRSATFHVGLALTPRTTVFRRIVTEFFFFPCAVT